MSLILDALNKADRERQANENPPGIHTVHDVQEFKPGKPAWLYLAIITFALIVVALLVFWLTREQPAPPAPATPAPAPVEQPKKSTSIPGLPKPVLVEKEKPATVNKSAINELYKQQVEAANNPEPQNQAPTTNASKTQTATANTGARQNADEHAAQAVARDEVRKKASPPAAPPPAMDRLSHYPEVGSIGDMPWTIINQMPSLNYSTHTYTNGGERKQIVINNQAKGEGESLAEGIRIEKILKDGAILEYQGHKFKLIALNSWVNI